MAKLNGKRLTRRGPTRGVTMKKRFLAFLRDRKRITDEQYEALCALQRTRNYFGIVALREEHVNPDQLEEALKEQSRVQFRERIGSIMKRKKFMTDEQIEDVLRKQRDLADFTGQLLVDLEVLSEKELRSEMEAFRNVTKKNSRRRKAVGERKK